MTVKRRPLLSVAFAALVAALDLAGATGCGNKPSASDCERLVRHIIDLEAAAAGAGAVPVDRRTDLEQRKKSMFQAVGTSYCRDEMPASQVECGLAARTLSELATRCERS